jgi:TonB family protein
LPEVPNMEMQPADLSLVQATNAPAKPKLDINAGSTPRLTQQSQKGDSVSAPELANGATAATGGPSSTIIALSGNPAPPAPVVEVPKGNLSARVSISPEGKGSGSGGVSGNGGGTGGGSGPSGGSATGNNSVGISISGGSPQPKSGMSGLGGGSKLIIPKPEAAYKRPDASVASVETTERVGPPNFAALPPGAPPEQVFSSHHVYSMNVNTPNLNSATGSWIIRFSELHLASSAHANDDVSSPVPLHAVDPKYPQDLLKEHVQGEVVLYAVIREDGSVDSIQLVHGVDPQLNTNSISAFGQWKFRPAMKDGQPIALEAIVHIPFREPPRE